MTRRKTPSPAIKRFADHEVITPDNKLRIYVRDVPSSQIKDDPVARANAALKSLSNQFDEWMIAECDRLSAAWELARTSLTARNRDELFRAAHDIKSGAATFGYPAAGAVAGSLCRIVEFSPKAKALPVEIIDHHVQGIIAIVREHSHANARDVARELGRRLRGVSDKYLKHANRDRPKYLEMLELLDAPDTAPES
jgi:HPt (histidine-containing phosphotransfer) domain-containing protein